MIEGVSQGIDQQGTPKRPLTPEEQAARTQEAHEIAEQADVGAVEPRLTAEQLAEMSYQELAEARGISVEEARQTINLADYMSMIVNELMPQIAEDPASYPTLKRGIIEAMRVDRITPESQPEDYNTILKAFMTAAKGAVRRTNPDPALQEAVRAIKNDVLAKANRAPRVQEEPETFQDQ